MEQILRGEVPDPTILVIDPTNVCNQNCMWCFVQDYRKANPVSLSRGTLLKLIKDIRGRIPAIAYSGGGDPLMNPATVDAIEAAGRDITQVLTTNGTGWRNTDEIERIAENCSVVRVSVDAATKKTYEKVHGSNLFERAKTFIEKTATLGCRGELSVSFMISPYNWKETIQAVKLYKRLGADRVTIKFVHSDFGDSTSKKVGFTTSEFIKKHTDELYAIMHMTKREETEHFSVDFRHPGEFEQMDVKHQKHLYRNCYLTPIINGGIAANGDVHLCCDRRGDLILGNVAGRHSFWDLWGTDYHKALLRGIRLEYCPARCRATEMNIIVERAFIQNEMMWELL